MILQSVFGFKQRPNIQVTFKYFNSKNCNEILKRNFLLKEYHNEVVPVHLMLFNISDE
jgi:hypothetical protein